jgi:1-acyl-sn-glycerol-3-phosphate acyltransferase
MIRFLCAAIFVVLFLIVSYPIFAIEWLIGKCNRKAKDYSSLRIVQWAFRVILRISGVTVTVRGLEQLPDEPTLFVANHRSVYDIIITYTHCKRLTGFVAKKEVEHVPSFSTWMRALYCLFLDRENPKEGLKTILTAIDYIEQGISIFIFPEGTRNKGEECELLPFKEGAFKIATKTDAPIVPVAIHRSCDVFEKQFPRIKKTHVVVEYGTPIETSKLSKEEKKHLGVQTQQIIEEMLKRLSNEQ